MLEPAKEDQSCNNEVKYDQLLLDQNKEECSSQDQLAQQQINGNLLVQPSAQIGQNGNGIQQTKGLKKKKMINIQKDVELKQKEVQNKIQQLRLSIQTCHSPTWSFNQSNKDKILLLRSKSPIAERLYEKKKESENKKSMQRQQFEKERLKNYPFSPRLKYSNLKNESAEQCVKKFLERQKQHQSKKEKERETTKVEAVPKGVEVQVELCSKNSQLILAQKQQNLKPVHIRLYTVRSATFNFNDPDIQIRGQCFSPRISDMSQNLRRNESIDTFLYEDAIRRRQQSQEKPLANVVSISLASTRLLRKKLEQEIKKQFDKHVSFNSNGKLNYLQMKKIMQDMNFIQDKFNTITQNEENLLKVM